MCVYVYVRIDRGIEWKSKKKIIERPLEIRRRKGFTRPMERDRHRRIADTLVPSVVFVNPAFSPIERVKGGVRVKRKKKKEHDFNPIDFGETRFDPRGNRIDLSWTRFKFVQWGISRNFNNFYRVDLECRKNRTSND